MLVFFVAFSLIPFVYTFVLMFDRGNILIGFHFVGLANIRAMPHDQLFLQSLRNTLLFMVFVIPLTLAFPLAIGRLLASSLKGIAVYRPLVYLPSLLSAVVTGLIWSSMIDPETGPLYRVINDWLGLDVPWLNNGTFALFFIAVVTLWGSVGFYAVIYMAGFNDIPNELVEAARIDGAGDWRIFMSIELPLLRRVTQLILVLVTINAIQVFDIVFVMTGGGPGTATYTIMWYIYQNVFFGGSVGYAAGMGVLVLVITLILAAIYMRGTRAQD
jgi:ABC-type sugar transport system permease subunit